MRRRLRDALNRLLDTDLRDRVELVPCKDGSSLGAAVLAAAATAAD